MPRVALSLLSLSVAWGHAQAAVGPERIDYDGKIGHIVQLQDGRLLTIYTLGRPSKDAALSGPEPPAYIRYSDDLGRSWSKEEIAFSFAAGRGRMFLYRQSVGPYLLLDRKGNLQLLSIRYYRNPKRGDPTIVALSELLHNKSADGGRTWTEPKRIDVGHHWFPCIESMIELSDGRLLTAGNYATDNYLPERGEYEYRILVIFSDDQGETWQLGPDDIRIPIGAGPGASRRHRAGPGRAARRPGLDDLSLPVRSPLPDLLVRRRQQLGILLAHHVQGSQRTRGNLETCGWEAHALVERLEQLPRWAGFGRGPPVPARGDFQR